MVAVPSTPVRVIDFLAAKSIFGVALAFTEVALLALLIRAFAVNAPAVIMILLLGAALVTGFGQPDLEIYVSGESLASNRIILSIRRSTSCALSLELSRPSP